MTRECGYTDIFKITDQNGMLRHKRFRCGATITDKKSREMDVCVSCGRASGTGHARTECMAGGKESIHRVKREGYFCDRGHPTLIAVE